MSERCNVLLIMTDQQSASAMSCTGNGDLQTPAMDSLARRGTRFSDAYCAFPLCLPARGAMMASRMPHEFGIEGNVGCIPVDQMPHTLGHLLGQAGYTCAYAGKTHLPKPADVETGDYYGWTTIAPWDDHAIAPACIDFLNRSHDRPFFLVASFDDPHNICEWARQQAMPYGEVPDVPTEQCPNLPANFEIPPYEPAVIRHLVRSNFPGHPMTDSEPDRWRHYRHAYFRLVERVDRYIGHILDALARRDDADQTLVIFTSDHGDGQGAHRLNQKSFLYDEQTRVPLMIVPPDGQSERIATTPVSATLDILPTICDYVGLDLPSDIRGQSLRPQVEQPVSDTERAVFCETNVYGHQPARMVRKGKFKYATYFQGPYREQLFDLEHDPGEMVNLAVEARHSHVLQTFRDLLAGWCERTNDKLNHRWGLVQRATPE